jgi:hypothetical protein
MINFLKTLPGERMRVAEKKRIPFFKRARMDILLRTIKIISRRIMHDANKVLAFCLEMFYNYCNE